ncbi:protein translocase subunit SecF [Cellvibrio sp. KY-YJ-3]|jgi:preprotein translocase subunit SecF|uniref:protein translocase subunit SecF n=1 Tax=Cellvibrio sp. KY-YJ-3 TaxID=454662 RepID=UPI001244B90E|nr:protein translocase subunit SecF [Cellvibrio sp. KY-YJ-3]QEY13525.1 protein translocase subunit SecF [Cellvibrio sp. KY-YJ-3]
MTKELRIIDFMGVRHYTSALSILIVIISLASLALNGLKLGLDFTGGTQLEMLLDRPADLDKIRDVLEKEELKSPVAVLFGSDQEVMIRTQDQMKIKAQEKLSNTIAALGSGAALESLERPVRELEGYADTLVIANIGVDLLQQKDLFPSAKYGRVEYQQRDGKVLVTLENSIDSVYLNQIIGDLEAATGAKIQLRSSEFVGPQIGDELRDQGGLGMLVAFVLVFLYVAVQFQWKFSTGAIIGLVHDVIVTLGFFAFFQWDFDLTVLAAILALIGYSINDTIVIYDRIRENFRILRKTDPHEVINISISQTLGRTIMTSASVFIVLFCLYFIAGEVLQGFALALIIGIVAGTYSSVYICANITAALGITKEDLMPKAKEEDGAEATEAP